MEINLNSTDVVAWWGAIIATSVLIWDIIKWKNSGPNIKLTIQGNMKEFVYPDNKEEIWIFVRAENIGDKATTITNSGTRYYKSFFQKLFSKPRNFVIKNIGITGRIPYVINPGTIWDGKILQDTTVESMLRNGFFYMDLYYSHSEKPITKRLKLKSR